MLLVALSLLLLQPTSPALALTSPPPFGHSLLDLFSLDTNYTNLNHGSYGSPPKAVSRSQRDWELRMEANPDRWFRFDVFGLMDQVRTRVASYIGAEAEDVAFIPNASHGVNAVLRSLQVPKGKKILFLNIAYQMVKNTLSYVSDVRHEQLLQVNITAPISPASIVAQVERALEQHKGEVFLCAFSHIVSIPGAILPVAELTRLSHDNGALVLIDGAHALGQIPLNMTALNADFWVGNGHKWLYSPKGSAVLWVRRDRQALIEPTTISWEGRGLSHFQTAFSYTGTASYSPYLAMGAALDFREWLGGEKKVLGYMHSLAKAAGQHLATAFGTEVLLPEEMYASLVDVRLPTNNSTIASNLPQQLLERYNTWVPVYALFGNDSGPFYTRVSCQIYTEMSDIEMLANAVLDLIAAAS
eukprot:jgi/Bigna1/74082/fgenesh1_pg.27_\